MHDELKACFEPSELPTIGGTRPLCLCGIRFTAHKIAALGILIDRFGVYLAHLTLMTEDSSIKSVDRKKLKGYGIYGRGKVSSIRLGLLYSMT